jgi:Immunoglobulin-like domain of bacterial spore germination
MRARVVIAVAAAGLALAAPGESREQAASAANAAGETAPAAAAAGDASASGRAAQPGPLTATGIRIAAHPGRVRVVVDFRGGQVLAGEVVATDPDPFGDGRARLPLSRRGVRTVAPPRMAHRVAASIVQRSNRIVIRLQAAPRRFKYVAYHALRSPSRLAIDLYEAAPPSRAAEIRRAPDGCLTLDDFDVDRRLVSASGRARDLFENALVVRLRRASGTIHRQRPATATTSGRWSRTFRYPRTRRRTGTLEAVALSAKDGTLDCLTQVRVRFGG